MVDCDIPNATNRARMQIQIESAADVWDEIQPLLMEHWREIAHFSDIPLAPRREVYEALDAAGKLRVFTLRETNESPMIGYAVYVVDRDVHYSGHVFAKQDILFISPEFRNAKFGKAMISLADASLRNEGVDVVQHHVKMTHDFGPLLGSLGYEPIETIYVKRLSRGR